MEVVVTRSSENTDELQHHGTKGMKWGQRLYQNKDGSLTPLGKKRYNKEVEKLKAEEAKVKAAEKAAKTKAKNQAKFDKLDEKKADLEARKKALKGKTDTDDKPEETVEQKRERLLKSTDAKEIYKDRDVLTYNELNDRINRIDLENRLMSKIPVETQKTGKEYMDKATKNIESATNLYKSVDSAFSTVKNSTIGKTLAKAMGIELPKEEKSRESLSDFLKNIDKKSDKEIQDRNQTENNIDALVNKQKQREKQAERLNKAAEANGQDKDSKDDKSNDPNNQNNPNKNPTGPNDTNQSEPNKDKQDKQSKQSEPKKDKQSEKKTDPEPEIIEPTKFKQKSSDNSNKKKGEDISDYVSWKDVSDDDSPARKEVNEVVKKSGSVKLSNADYKQYEKDIKAWREKYDSEDSPYSQKQMLDALYEIEKEHGISWRRLGEG